MQKLLANLLLILGLSSCVSSKIQNDLILMNINGNVKVVTEREFNATDKFGEIIKGDKKKFSRITVSNFNEKGNLSEVNMYSVDNLAGDKFADFEKLKHRRKYFYNKTGQLIERNSYGDSPTKEGMLQDRSIYAYDKNNNKILETAHTGYDRVEFIIKSKYDEKNKILEQALIMTKGKYDYIPDWRKIYQYDKYGNVDVMFFYAPPDSLSYTMYYGYLKGLKAWERTDSYPPTTYVYDDHNNIVQEKTVYETSDEVRTYIYNYDKHGNWTQKVETYNGNTKFLITRELQYSK